MSRSPSPPLPPLSPSPHPTPNLFISSVLPSGPFQCSRRLAILPKAPKASWACPVPQASALTLPLETISRQHTTVTHIFQECGARGPIIGGPGGLKWRSMGKTSFPTGMSRRVSSGSLLSSTPVFTGQVEAHRVKTGGSRNPHLSHGLF